MLLDSRGRVELQRGGGDWGPASKGARLRASDGLRTPLDGEAALSVDGIQVRVHDRSELRVVDVKPGLLQARVRGRIESQVEDGKARLSLQVADGSATAESAGGHFFVTAEGRGVVVAATRGSVDVSPAGGKPIRVEKGQSAKVEGGTLQRAQELRKVLLAIRWPGDKTNRSSVPLAGRVAAGSRVYVQGLPVEVAPSGEFRADVRLRDGRQRVAIVTVDPFGRRREEEADITRDDTLPAVQMQSPWRR